MNKTIYLSLVKWSCEYCKLNFDDVRLVIIHEKQFCKINPNSKSFKLITNLKEKKDLLNIMIRHSAVDFENSVEPLLGNLRNSRTRGYKQDCCYFICLLVGTSVPLILGFYIGYNYEAGNCPSGSD